MLYITLEIVNNCLLILFKLNVSLASDMILDTKQMTYKNLLNKQMLCSRQW